MDVALAEIIIPFFAAMGLGTMVLIGMKLRYSHKARLAEQSDGGDVERLTAAVGDLFDEVQALREGVTDMGERLEFTERMLTKGNPQDPHNVDTPA